MPKIERKTQQIFCNSADSDQLAVFGSMATGTPVYSNDVEELQSNEAFQLGWDAATLEDKAPFMEEMNGLQYSITKQLAYIYQEGLPEWDAQTIYYIGAVVKVINKGIPLWYRSLTNDNVNNYPIDDSVNWREIPLTNSANIDLSNLTNEGQNIANWSTNVTNCLVEVPQNIKLELNNGTLTLKAGSKVIVPNGAGVFDEVVITSDLSFGGSSINWSNTSWLVYRPNGTLFVNNGYYTSGSTYTGGTYGIWYDTTNNSVKYTSNGGSTWASGYSLPLAQITVTSGTGVTSIDQVFNGMGYIGRTLWLDKGVKLLVGDGRNADGTIKNAEITTKLLIKTSHNYTEDRLLFYKKSGALEDIAPRRYLTGLKKDMPTTVSETVLYNYFCTDTLETYWTNGSTTANWQQAEYKTPIAVYGAIKEADGKTITHLTPYQTFRAVDYNEFKQKADKSEVLKINQITNCVTEIPQKIKLELKNGVLTLKTGSCLIIPNGKNNDGSLKFDELITSKDYSWAYSGTAVGEGVPIGLDDGTGVYGLWARPTNVFSGTSEPSTGSVWYDTTNNVIKHRTNNTAAWTTTDASGNKYFLPFCIFTSASNAIDSVKKVFNGIGYIGSTFWFDKGVKVLIPNGRNTDGTLKNNEYTLDRVRLNTFASNFTNYAPIGLATWGAFYWGPQTYIGGERPSNPLNYTRWYNEEENWWYEYVNGWNKQTSCPTGYANVVNGVIKEFNPYTTFRAVDYNEFVNVQQRVYLKVAYQNGTSGYNIWSNGYCEQWGVATLLNNDAINEITLLKSYKDTSYLVIANGHSNVATNVGGVDVFHSAPITNSIFNITWDYASNKQLGTANWIARGYIS